AGTDAGAAGGVREAGRGRGGDRDHPRRDEASERSGGGDAVSREGGDAAGLRAAVAVVERMILEVCESSEQPNAMVRLRCMRLHHDRISCPRSGSCCGANAASAMSMARASAAA